jgi:hypothetical protein
VNRLVLAGIVALLLVALVILLGATLAFHGGQGVSAAAAHPILGPIAGFLTAWLIFELTERRRSRMARNAIRTAVVGELRHVELLLANMVVGYAWGPTGTGVDRAVREVRWLFAPERKRIEGVGFFEATREGESQFHQLRELPDPQIAQFLRMHPSTEGRRPLEVHLPVIDAVFRQPQTGFTERQIQLIGSVRWQLQLLNDGAQWAHRFFEMSFTVTDPENHRRVEANHQSCRDEHRHRAGLALDEVRSAISILET